ncbi:MAG: hypothetical protein ABW252_14805 [Polyangiales bacterium]
MQLPDFPAVPPDQRTTRGVFVQYEDVAQDGSLKVGGMPAAIGLVCMGKLWFKTPLARMTGPNGIVAILTRIAMQTTGGPVSVRKQIEVDGLYQLAHTRDGAREVSRIFVNGHAELYAPIGRTHAPQPPNAGDRVHVGRVFAEHVFTRPFAPAGTRKVFALPSVEGPYVPELQLPQRDPASILRAPEGAIFLEPVLQADPTPVTFGLSHTDSNQHVNSLVYPQLFEDAALRRLMDLGHDTSALLVELIDVSFRKPCFAGDRVFVTLRTFEQRGQLGAVAFLGPKGVEAHRSNAMCALRFRRGPLGQG